MAQGSGSNECERTWSSGRRFPERSSSRVVTDDNEVAVRRCVDSLVVSVTRMSRADSCDSWSQKKSAGAGAAVTEAATDAQARAIPPYPRLAG